MTTILSFRGMRNLYRFYNEDSSFLGMTNLGDFRPWNFFHQNIKLLV
ncbi:hypothetical protein [Flavobacterium gilvum]|nr:hypothetical protein [Flavobacterium gilvum]